MIELIKFLGKKNSFKTYVKGYSHSQPPMIPSFEFQRDLVYKISELEENSVFIGHINFLNFSSFGKGTPIYMNLVRDPIDRLISAHYYNRRADVLEKLKESRPWLGDTDQRWVSIDFNECVRSKFPDCRFEYGSTFPDRYWSRQMLFFCGTEKICATFNTKAALQRAKYNVEQHYAVVGSWEDTNMTLAILEHHIPRFFRNAKQVFYDNFSRIRNRNRVAHPEVAQDVRRMLKLNFTNEYEFYYFCKQRLYQQFLTLNKIY